MAQHYGILDEGFGGCQFHTEDRRKKYLPLVKSSLHTTIRADTQQTILKQTFLNSTKDTIKTCKYSFPIYAGVSVVGFVCEIAGRKLLGKVKEKVEAKAEFDAEVSKGKKAGLLEQSSTSDIFSTSLGNVEAGQEVLITITYIGELKNDLDNDGIRLTIPNKIAPRYGYLPVDLRVSENVSIQPMDICIDVLMPKEKPISALESTSHPVSISLGRLAMDTDQEPSFSRASATISLGAGGLQKDFVLLVKAKDTGLPTAMLETHPTLENHRALLASLVPKFSLPSTRPEIVFVADRSGSMADNIPMLREAIKVFLKSLPAGVKFNICSFGSTHSFLWPKSQSYTKETLIEANKHVEAFDADFGGTETLAALQATIKNRWADIALEIILLTDGDIWAQEEAFAAINKAVADSKNQIRVFPLGIGNGVSHSLIEGLSRAGNGFAQAVQFDERIDTRVIRMLKAALTPHISNYTLEIKYENENDDDFELIDAIDGILRFDTPGDTGTSATATTNPAISLFDTAADPDKLDTKEDNKPPVPGLEVPKLLQAPHVIPTLFSFSRTTVYVMLSPDTIQKTPTSVVLKAESEHGQLRLEIPVTVLDTPGETIFQLAARKAVQDLEEHRGWIYSAVDQQGKKILEVYPSRAEDIIKQEAVRLGTTYRVANKWCSFVAVEADSAEAATITVQEPPIENHEDDENNDSLSGSSDNCKVASRFLRDEASDSDEDMGCGLFDDMEPESQSGLHGLRNIASPAPKYRGGRGGAQMYGGRGVGRGGTPGGYGRGGGRGGGGYQGSYRGGNITQGPRTRSAMPVAALPSPARSTRQVFCDTDGAIAPKKKKQAVETMSDTEKVHHLISLQDFDGYWTTSVALENILGLKTADLRAHSGNEWITALVVTFLKTQMANEKDVWELVVDKAVEWLDQQKVDKTLLSEAEAYSKHEIQTGIVGSGSLTNHQRLAS